MYHRSQLFLDAVRDTYLIQQIDTPTRYMQWQNPHILDLLFTTENNMISNAECHAEFGLSNYVIITYNLQVSSQNQKKSEPRFRYQKDESEFWNWIEKLI
ncbi:hypothetical protein LSH36_67g06028 [Paralvinella palmiformis]|uniref:Uncharacterized protein n=1 Tax=Paralvinella palmiformis TaxID=53620 RepID=A0AAD9ND71_9ANNE|nr:hypothetical protein LSH36_67g06028 [Paralvinella palmiformis]